MEAPKCRLCGERHYGQCPVFDRVAKAPPGGIVRATKQEVRAVALVRPEPRCPHCGKLPTDPVKPPFDRKAYQRDYMRKRRAKKT